MNVCAIIVTRGDQNLAPVVSSLPPDWEVVVWDNSRERDLAVYGRYAAIERTSAEVIYVQDDDCVVSAPDAIVEQWYESEAIIAAEHGDSFDFVVCNMPQEFRHSFYEEHALVGFGAVFHRDAPFRAFARVADALPHAGEEGWLRSLETPFFHRTCDVAFTGLTPRVLVDVPHEDLPHAHYETRMWRQPGHQAERVRMLDLVRQIA